MKRFYFWALLVTLIIILVGVIWFFFFKTDNTPTTIGGGSDLPISGDRPRKPITNNNQPSTGEDTSYEYVSPLVRIWDKPVAGFTFAVVPVITTSTSTNESGQEISTQSRATTTYLFFVEKSSGNVYKKDLSTNKVFRVTNTTIPAVQDAVFLKGGELVLMQTYNKESRKLETFVADVPPVASVDSPMSLGNPSYLQDNVISFAPSFDFTTLYYLVPNEKGSSLYRYTKERGSVFVESVPLKDITLSVTNKDVYVVSKPSAFVPGYVFKTSPFVVVYGGKTGFSLTPAPTNAISLVSMWSNSGLFSYVHNFTNGGDSTLKNRFLAEKCAWSNTSTLLFCAGDPDTYINQDGLPEMWYLGDISFKDTLYIITGVSGVFSDSELLNISDEGGESLDVIKPSFDTLSYYFSFINKKDGALWLLDVTRTVSR